MGPAPARVVGLPMSTLQQEYCRNRTCRIGIGSLDRNSTLRSFHNIPICDLSLNCKNITKAAYRWRATRSAYTACATKLGTARSAIAGYFGRAVPKRLLAIISTIIGRISTVSAEVSSILLKDGH